MMSTPANGAGAQSHERAPYWSALLIGTVFSCILANILAVLQYQGAFDSWRSIDAPPSGIAKVIIDSDQYILVETHDGRTFAAPLDCGTNAPCGPWSMVEDGLESRDNDFRVIRGTDCSDLRNYMFPLNPRGRIIECIYADFPGPEWVKENYFALMADGSLRYWANSTGGLFGMMALFIFSTIVFPAVVAVIISLVYLGAFVKRRIQEKRESVPRRTD